MYSTKNYSSAAADPPRHPHQTRLGRQNLTTHPVKRQDRNQPNPICTRAISMSEGLRACVQGPPFWPRPFFANHENMVQANFMLRAVARWRAPDARNSNKSLLMPAADPHVNCRCAYHGVCLSTTALRVGEGFAESGHTNLQEFRDSSSRLLRMGMRQRSCSVSRVRPGDMLCS